MKKRWLFYPLAGILFGIFDFYFQAWINQLFPMGKLSSFAMLVPILGIWLVLVVPIALHEAKNSRSAWLAAAAGAFTWSVSVIAYYLYMGVKLILIGEASRPEMHFSNRSDPYYWSNVRSFFVGDFWDGVSEWIIVAVVGGGLIGLLIGFFALRHKNDTNLVKL